MKFFLFDQDQWDDIFSHIKKHKTRTFLTAFGVFWGIFLLLLMLGTGSGVENGVFRQFGKMAVNSLHFWGGRTTLPYKGNRPGRWISFTDEDTKAIQALIPGIRQLCPRLQVWWTITVRHDKESGSFNLEGDIPEITRIEPVFVTEGRFLNQRDINEQRKVAVIGTGVRELLFDPGLDPVGEYIDINGVSFMVIGVFDFDSYGGNRRSMLETIYIPLTTMQKTFNLMNRVGWYSALIEDGVSAASVEAQAISLMKSRHNINPRDNRALGSWDSSREYKNLQGLFSGIRIFIWIVGIGTLMAGIIGVSNIMLIIVQERTREIGIRKALGATPFSIITMILQEAFFITSISGYLGMISGIMITEGIAAYMRKNALNISYFSEPDISLAVALSAMILLVVAGTLAGLFPALKASKIHPVEALKEE